MKNTILIKNHKSVQLAHLYEHLFLMQLNEWLYSKGLFKWIDYHLNGSTFEEGSIVTVDFKAYSSKAIELMNDIEKIRIPIDQDSITKALLQISAEEEYELCISDSQKLLKELMQLDENPWSHLDEVVFIDTKLNRRQASPIYLTDSKSKKPSVLKISLDFNNQHASNNRESVAVFNLLARMILMSSTYLIAKNTGSYQAEQFSEADGARLTTELHFSKLTSFSDHNYCVEFIRDSFDYMKKNGMFDRVADYFDTISYQDNPHEAPNFELALADTKVLMGSKGWAQFSDVMKIDKILMNVDIVVRSPRKTTRSSLISKS